MFAQRLLDRRLHAGVDSAGAPKVPPSFLGHGGRQVTSARLAVHCLPGGREAEALFRTFVRFLFGHQPRSNRGLAPLRTNLKLQTSHFMAIFLGREGVFSMSRYAGF